MIRAVFFDIDGTLLPHQWNSMPEDTVQALRALQAQGIMAVVSTGRNMQEFQKLTVSSFPFDGYLTLNGQLCMDRNREYFAGTPISPVEMDVLVGIFEAGRIPFLLIGRDGRYINYVDQLVVDVQGKTNGTIPTTGRYSGEEIFQICAYVDEHQKSLLDGFLDECDVTAWHEHGIDIIPKGGGKDRGIALFCEKYGIDQSETMAFGDAPNDISMLHYCAIGVAMGNATQDVKAAADYVTDDCKSGGIANALYALGVLKPDSI